VGDARRVRQTSAWGSIGLIVAGSLATGLVVAMVLVAAPFTEAKENVLTGMVLLAFSQQSTPCGRERHARFACLDATDAAAASHAIRDVVASVRTSRPLG
jgi:hypothetical protein